VTTENNNPKEISPLEDSFLVIPTAGDREEFLNEIIIKSRIPISQVIVIATKKNVQVPKGVNVIEDLGSPNIQRWWNTGIIFGKQKGAKAIAVLNDDLKINDYTIQTLITKMLEKNAAIASPSRPKQKSALYKSINFPYTEKIVGSIWVLNTKSNIVPDENYVWYYGDVDLDIKARRSKMGLVTAEVFFEHLYPGVGTSNSSFLTKQTHNDARYFKYKHPFISKSMVLGKVINQNI
jgi:GT2 family glycosyltransferase